MKTHLAFTKEIQDMLNAQLGDKDYANRLTVSVVAKAAQGVAPEGAGSTVTKIAESIFGLEQGHVVAIAPPRVVEPARPAVVPPAPVAHPFRLSARSQQELLPVRPELARTVELAITMSEVDFRVNQGLRTMEEQKKAVASGNSRTMHSKHLRQADGNVWAVDLVVLKDGVVSWRFETYAYIAAAMDQAATKLGYASHIRWGCAWDRVLADFGGEVKDYLAEAKAYANRHAGSDLLDAPHFEWVA